MKGVTVFDEQTGQNITGDVYKISRYTFVLRDAQGQMYTFDIALLPKA